MLGLMCWYAEIFLALESDARESEILNSGNGMAQIRDYSANWMRLEYHMVDMDMNRRMVGGRK